MSGDGVKITRRRLLLGAAGVAAAGGAAVLWQRSLLSVTELGVTELADAAGPAAGLGDAYLELVPEEHDEPTLVRLLEDELAGSLFEQLRARARERIQRDFREGDVVAVDGWQLSRTEARFYALASIRNRS